MSNVIMGVLACALFIILALASTLLLGTNFLQASATGTAAQIIQSLHQMTEAAALYQTRTGEPLMEGDGSALIPRFLSHKPVHPWTASTAYEYEFQFTGNKTAPQAPRGVRAQYAIVALYNGGADDRKLSNVCDAIVDEVGADNPNMGCMPYARGYLAWEKL